jgi:hypothetical protein
MRPAIVVCAVLACGIYSATAVTSQAEIKKPIGAGKVDTGRLKMGPSRMSREDCANKKGVVKDVIRSLCSSGFYCSYTKPDGSADVECIDEKKP